MIGNPTSKREVGLHRVQPVHGCRRRRRSGPCVPDINWRELTIELGSRLPKEVAVQGEHFARLASQVAVKARRFFEYTPKRRSKEKTQARKGSIGSYSRCFAPPDGRELIEINSSLMSESEESEIIATSASIGPVRDLRKQYGRVWLLSSSGQKRFLLPCRQGFPSKRAFRTDPGRK